MLIERPENIAESLIKDHMKEVYFKLDKKINSPIKGKGYGLTMTDKEAKAYFIYFHNRYLGQYGYLENIVRTHINLLDQKYA
jgi:hypothetical protein